MARRLRRESLQAAVLGPSFKTQSFHSGFRDFWILSFGGDWSHRNRWSEKRISGLYINIYIYSVARGCHRVSVAPKMRS